MGFSRQARAAQEAERMDISLPACLFVGAMLLLLAVGYLWFERGGANFAGRQQKWLEMRRYTPRLSPKVEDDERRLRNLEAPADPAELREWKEARKRDLGEEGKGPS